MAYGQNAPSCERLSGSTPILGLPAVGVVILLVLAVLTGVLVVAVVLSMGFDSSKS